MSIEILFEAEDDTKNDKKPKTADVTSDDIGDDGFGGDVGEGLKDEEFNVDDDVDESEDSKDTDSDNKDKDNNEETPDVPADDNDDGLDGDGDGLSDDELDPDASSDDDSTDDTSTDTEETPTEDQSNSPDKAKQNLLLKTTINLYNHIKMNVSKIDGIRCDTIIVNKVVIQVKKNLLKLLDVIYDYITSKFRNLKYVENLYMYNYFLESYKINIEMLKKIGNFSGND